MRRVSPGPGYGLRALGTPVSPADSLSLRETTLDWDKVVYPSKGCGDVSFVLFEATAFANTLSRHRRR